uniref:Uncharacterized protein n=1 Tax=Cacopsylla melanoneura TaxID=428564 RepID=A0A8D9AJR7_9HEMI
MSASAALSAFSKNCKAERPDTLRSTLLRKSIATFSSLLNMTESDMQNLATFMGHNFQIHSEFYKLPSEVSQLCHLSKLLTALDENKGDKYIGKSLNEIITSQNDRNIDIESILETVPAVEGEGICDLDEDSGRDTTVEEERDTFEEERNTVEEEKNTVEEERDTVEEKRNTVEGNKTFHSKLLSYYYHEISHIYNPGCV